MKTTLPTDRPGRIHPLLPSTLIPCGNSHAESQRDSGLQPRVARNELPWESGPHCNNPNGVAARRWQCAATPLGLGNCPLPTQGSSFLATLGWRTQPRWGCRGLLPAHLAAQRSSERNNREALRLTTDNRCAATAANGGARRFWSAVTCHRFGAGDLSPSNFRAPPFTRACRRWREP